jgi:FKBP-type peptidyl-prolyl cis-trans isomerase SlpA
MAHVGIEFSLWLSDGVLVDRTEAGEIMTFEAGDGQWLPALEAFVLSVPMGETGQFLIPPEQAFGFPDPNQIHWVPMGDMGLIIPEVNQIIEFNLPNGDTTAARVLAVDEDLVQLDFSHPLAGHELILEVTRVS